MGVHIVGSHHILPDELSKATTKCLPSKKQKYPGKLRRAEEEEREKQ
jgi:hypothetical protein